jgi:hypothetical protein
VEIRETIEKIRTKEKNYFSKYDMCLRVSETSIVVVEEFPEIDLSQMLSESSVVNSLTSKDLIEILFSLAEPLKVLEAHQIQHCDIKEKSFRRNPDSNSSWVLTNFRNACHFTLADKKNKNGQCANGRNDLLDLGLLFTKIVSLRFNMKDYLPRIQRILNNKSLKIEVNMRLLDIFEDMKNELKNQTIDSIFESQAKFKRKTTSSRWQEAVKKSQEKSLSNLLEGDFSFLQKESDNPKTTIHDICSLVLDLVVKMLSRDETDTDSSLNMQAVLADLEALRKLEVDNPELKNRASTRKIHFKPSQLRLVKKDSNETDERHQTSPDKAFYGLEDPEKFLRVNSKLSLADYQPEFVSKDQGLQRIVSAKFLKPIDPKMKNKVGAENSEKTLNRTTTQANLRYTGKLFI